MITTADIVETAREWVGTPYHHQAKLRGVGADCVGLIRGIGEELGVLDTDPGLWRQFAGYSRLPNPRRMRRAMEIYLDPWPWHPADRDGLILWLSWRLDLPMHLAICTGPTIIHAYSDAGAVVEHGFTREWRDRVHSAWTFRGVTE